MEYFAQYGEVITIAGALTLLVICFFLYQAGESYKSQLKAVGLRLAELQDIKHSEQQMREARTAAETSLKETEKQLFTLKEERGIWQQQKEQLVADMHQKDTQAQLALQKVQEEEKRRKDWEEQKKRLEEQFALVSAQAEKRLLELHKNETEAARKQNEELAKKQSEEVLGNLGKLIQLAATSSEQFTRSETKWDAVMKALAAPSNAGKMAEVGLENTLKNLGFQAGRDYVMQYAIHNKEEGKLRPDAVLFLPQDMVVVIDAKASKHVLDIAQATSEQQESEQLQKLKKTMNDHLHALKSKDYKSAIETLYRESGRAASISMTLMVMYIPTETALENLTKVDAEFLVKCEKAGIIPVTPASLFGLLSLASRSISTMYQAENHKEIMQEVEALVQYVVKVLEYAETLGSNLITSVKGYNTLAKSVNGRLLGKIKTLQNLGVDLPKNKALPGRLPTYEYMSSTSPLIEAEVESEEESPRKIEPFLRNKAVEG